MYLFVVFLCVSRYIFRSSKKVGLQELGPRFTLKLRSLQKGTFNSKYGDYIWLHKVCPHLLLGTWLNTHAHTHHIPVKRTTFFLSMSHCSEKKWIPAERDFIYNLFCKKI